VSVHHLDKLELFAKVGPSEKVQEIRSMRCDMVNGVHTGQLPRYGDVRVVGVLYKR
jgi:hypothetical protein